MTCEVKNVVYVTKCRGCNEEYIGETGILLRRHVTVHNQQIRDPKARMLFVSEHLGICARQTNPTFYIFPFYKMYLDSTSLRRVQKLFYQTYTQIKQGFLISAIRVLCDLTLIPI